MTVDVIVVGTSPRALAAALESAQNGRRVLVIARVRGAEFRRQVQRARKGAGAGLSGRITVMTGAEVQCIAGTRTVEAVLARYVRSGRRIDINATALLTFDDEPEPATEDLSKE